MVEFESNLTEDDIGHLKLFDSLLAFDRSGVLETIRHREKHLTEELKRNVFKGYSKISHFSDAELEKRFRSVLRQPQKSALAHQLIGATIFPSFMGPTINLFESCFLSQLNVPLHLRIQRALASTCNVAGWTRQVAILILRFNPKSLEGELLPVDTLDELSEEESSAEEQNAFFSGITNDAVMSWRCCFPYDPSEIFGLSETSKKSEIRKRWNFISESLSRGNLYELASILEAEIKKSKDDQGFSEMALRDLLLLGIDLKNIEKVSKGLELIEALRGKDPHERSRYDPRLLSSLVLGYAFLRNYDSALGRMAEIPGQDFDGDLAGLAGTICAMAGHKDYAIRCFTASLKNRTYPSAWPVKALLAVAPELKEPLVGLCFSEVISVSVGNQIIEKIFDRHGGWDLNENPLVKFGSARPNLGSSVPLTQGKSEEDEVEQSAPQDGIVLGAKLEPLEGLEHVAEITEVLRKTEASLLESQNKKDWGSVVELGNQLQELEQRAISEIRKAYTCVEHNDIESSPIKALLTGEKGKDLLEKSTDRLYELYWESSRKREEALIKERADLFSRLKKANLQDHIPQQNLGVEELTDFKNKILQDLTKAENLIDLRSGVSTVSRFISDFPIEAERTEIAEGILEKFSKGNIQLGKNLKDIILLIKWPPAKAKISLALCSEGTKKQIQNPDFDEANFRNCLLPLVVGLSDFAGISPLYSILGDDYLQNALFTILESVSPEDGANLLRSISQAKSVELASDLAKLALSQNRVVECRNYLLKWDELIPDLSVSDKVMMWSIWVDAIQKSPIETEILSELEPLKRLVASLVDEKRIGEAVLWVSCLWRAFHDERVLEGFEDPFFEGLLFMLRCVPHSKEFVRAILEKPEWLVRQKEGCLAFLFLCHVGDLRDLFEQIRYEYFVEFEKTRSQYPVLVDQFFVRCRFSQDDHPPNSGQLSAEDARKGLKAIEELEHDLMKSSCFRGWHPATDYQDFFNIRIRDLKNQLVSSSHNDLDELENRIESVDAIEWINEADRGLHNKVKHPAVDLMVEYIDHQSARLRQLLYLKKIAPIGKLLTVLGQESKPLRQRIQSEFESLRSPSRWVKSIYQAITEEMK